MNHSGIILHVVRINAVYYPRDKAWFGELTGAPVYSVRSAIRATAALSIVRSAMRAAADIAAQWSHIMHGRAMHDIADHNFGF